MLYNAAMKTFAQKKARAEKIAEMLIEMYPRRKTVLNFKTNWECLVAVQLSAQCTDKRVNIVTPALFKAYPRVEDYAKAGVNADGSANVTGIRDFEDAIRSTGFYHNKAKNILAAAQIVVEKFGGELPSTMDELLTLPGVARKSANVILFNAFDKIEGIAVDTHVIRITKLLGLISKNAEGNPIKIERELMALLPRKHWALFSLLLAEHGREICVARRPKHSECKLNKICPSAEG